MYWLLEFLDFIGKLKVTQRTGWITQAKLKKVESVADHSFRCAIMAMCIGDKFNVKTENLIRMLLLHDIQEALTGDYDSDTKKRLGAQYIEVKEKDAIKKILSLLPKTLENKYKKLWSEFKSQSSLEAKLANDIDKIEMLIQALDYEKQGIPPDKLDSFWKNSKQSIKTPIAEELLVQLFQELHQHRKTTH